jgi:DnaK suppressor protein
MDLERLKSRLAERTDELRALLAATEENRKPVELDQVAVGRLSRMDALQGQAMAMAAKRQYEQEIARIDAALKRIDRGEYGACVSCGEDISAARLLVDPTNATCIDCASGR